MEIGPAGVPPSKFVISPLSGNIGIDSGHDTVMLPYPPIKLPKPHVTRYLSLWHQYSTTKRAVLKKHFPISRASGFMFIYMTHKLFWQQTAVKCNAVKVGAVGVSERSFGQQKTVTEASVMTEQNSSRAVVGMKEVVFYYDVVCPFPFMASTCKLIEGVARRIGAKIRLKPQAAQTLVAREGYNVIYITQVR